VHALVVLSLLTLAPGSGAPRPAEAQGSGNIAYAYDQLGRLIAVTDLNAATNVTAVYGYDALGNLTSITRQSATQLALFEFAPHRGLAGTASTSVTLYGTGFSPCTSSCGANSVTVGGVAVSVTGATSTQLTASVPNNLAGAITVTVGGASVNSSASFVGSTATGSTVPTITVVTGTATVNGAPVAAPGDTVTLAGTNLATSFPRNTAVNTAANNVVTVNGVRAAVTQGADSSHLNAKLPPKASTGHVELSTPGGTATRSDYLFVPPTLDDHPYTAAEVVVADALVANDSNLNHKTITTSTASGYRVALLAFEGTAGHRMSVTITGSTYSGFCHPKVRFVGPDGSTQGTPSTCAEPVVEAPQLPATGTYVIAVQTDGNAGSMTLTLYDQDAPLTGTITLNGPVVTVEMTQPNQIARLTFQGTAGQLVTVAIGCGGFPPTGCTGFPANTCFPKISIRTRADESLGSGSSTVCIEPTASAYLPASGEYVVVVDAQANNVGSTCTPDHHCYVPIALYFGYPTPGVGTPSLTPTSTPTRTNTPTPTNTATVGPSPTPNPSFSPTRGATATPLTTSALVVRPNSIAMGRTASADWLLVPPDTPSANDKIGLFPWNTPDDGSPIAWVYTTGQASGQVSVPIPTSGLTAPADYELHLYGGTAHLVSNRFTITAATASPTPGSGASLTARPTVLPAGGVLSAAWSGVATPTPRDWIGLYAPGAADGSTKPPTWAYTTGQASGQVTLSPPSSLAPGSYELRLFANDGFTRLAVSNTFVVTAPISGGVSPGALLLRTIRLLSASDDAELPASADNVQQVASAASSSPALTANATDPSLDDEDDAWTPDPTFVPGLLNRPSVPSRWQALPALDAPAGETALAGQVLRATGGPLEDVTLRLGEQTAESDATGRFLLTHVPAGHHELVIDGRTASTPDRTYGVFVAGVDLFADTTTALPYTIWMTPLDTANTVTIPSPTT
jgi:YD repeat-containing protein